MEASEDSGPQIALIEGEAVIHQRFGGAGPSSRGSTLNSARKNAHDGLMRVADKATGEPDPKCVDSAGENGIAHTVDCDHATGLIEQLRAMFTPAHTQE